jgi:hypothetical protein
MQLTAMYLVTPLLYVLAREPEGLAAPEKLRTAVLRADKQRQC